MWLGTRELQASPTVGSVFVCVCNTPGPTRDMYSSRFVIREYIYRLDLPREREERDGEGERWGERGGREGGEKGEGERKE